MSDQSIAILTHSPSPYQVELFNALASQRLGETTAIYLWEADPARSWSVQQRDHSFISLAGHSAKFDEARKIVLKSDLSVFNFYTDRFAKPLIDLRANSGNPWVFWGERPGFRVHSLFGKLVRRWKLRALHQSGAPIWGIGRRAVDQYRKEFGNNRRYANVPYYSDLRRFEPQLTPQSDKCVFLFSGSLSKRKGADLLAEAFVDVARSHPDVELIVLGEGECLPAMKRILSPYANRVHFLGFKDWDELPGVYRSAHFLCAPSRYDGWGMVVPEALAAGLPVISTDRTGAAIEFIQTGTNGWLIPAGDLGALTDAMRAAASRSQAERKQLSANARAAVTNHQLADGVRKIMNEIDHTLANW